MKTEEQTGEAMSRLNLRTSRVQSSFKTLQTRLSVLLRKVNAEAAAQMKAGRYDAATTLIDIGRSFSEFNAETDEYRKAWDQLASQATTKLADLGLPMGSNQHGYISKGAVHSCAPNCS
jgi:hypothetical protein